MPQKASSRGHRAIGRDVFKAKRDRTVAIRSVVCPSCGALVGEPCLSAAGKATRHDVRRVMALRAEREAG